MIGYHVGYQMAKKHACSQRDRWHADYFHFFAPLYVCLCVTGGHKKGMLRVDWWLRVIYGEPGLQDGSPLLHHFVSLCHANYQQPPFHDELFPQTCTLMTTTLQYEHTHCMFTPTQPALTDVQMTALFRTTLRVCFKEKNGEKEGKVWMEMASPGGNHW